LNKKRRLQIHLITKKIYINLKNMILKIQNRKNLEKLTIKQKMKVSKNIKTFPTTYTIIQKNNNGKIKLPIK